MFRQMRRIKQELPLDEAKKLLKKNKRGVLSLNGEDGYPYSLPINFSTMPKKINYTFTGQRRATRWTA